MNTNDVGNREFRHTCQIIRGFYNNVKSLVIVTIVLNSYKLSNQNITENHDFYSNVPRNKFCCIK